MIDIIFVGPIQEQTVLTTTEKHNHQKRPDIIFTVFSFAANKVVEAYRSCHKSHKQSNPCRHLRANRKIVNQEIMKAFNYSVLLKKL